MTNSIAKIRKQHGISQASLGAAVGWGQPRIANYEGGDRTPNINDCRELCRAFAALGVKVTLDDLFPPAAPNLETTAAEDQPLPAVSQG